MKITRSIVYLLTLASCLLSLSGCRLFYFTFHSSSSPYQHLQQAEEYSRAQKFELAIEEYRLHIQQRLAVSNRPDWENPYFYLLLIGDLQLQQGQSEAALKTYQEADANQVDKYLVSDRFRSIASQYEKNNQLQQALEVLSKYRERDPLLFDTMADRIAKELTNREENIIASPSAVPSATASPLN